MKKDELVRFGIGLAIGAVVAASIALLYAPQEGTKTRNMIKNKASEFKQKLTGKLGHKEQ